MLIADENEEALRSLHEVLSRLGHEVTPYAVSVREAVELIATEDPEVAIVVVHNDDEHALALISEAVSSPPGPVIAQLPDADVAFLARAADAGHLGLYGIDGPRVGPGGDRGGGAPLPRDAAADREGRAARERARSAVR